MSVRVHTHGSNRDRPSQAEKRVVFKGVLDNPFRIHWPTVPVNLQNLVLAQILSLLDGVSKYQYARLQIKQKRKREWMGKPRPRKKRKETEATTDHSEDLPTAEADSGSNSTSTNMQVDAVSLEPPAILAHLILGINQVTKRIEELVRIRRGRIDVSSVPDIRIVLVCRADINPPMLIDHLPHLVAAYNSTKPSDPIFLVPLPQGAELTLSEVMGIRRVAVMAVNSGAPGLPTILSLITSVPSLTASWLATEVAVSELKRSTAMIPTHIKQLRTTAPKDMKAVKEQRAVDRAVAKEKKKQQEKTEKLVPLSINDLCP